MASFVESPPSATGAAALRGAGHHHAGSVVMLGSRHVFVYPPDRRATGSGVHLWVRAAPDPGAGWNQRQRFSGIPGVKLRRTMVYSQRHVGWRKDRSARRANSMGYGYARAMPGGGTGSGYGLRPLRLVRGSLSGGPEPGIPVGGGGKTGRTGGGRSARSGGLHGLWPLQLCLSRPSAPGRHDTNDEG